jgi:acyl-CoA thioester hydrolase
MKEKFVHKVRVRYGETDQMGYVYYGNYALYFEEARTELIRSVGLSYKELEQKGVMLPVVNMNVEYKQPAVYDELLTITTCIKGNIGRKITFVSEVYNEAGNKLNTAEITLVFITVESGKVISCPDFLKSKLSKYVHD